MAGPLNELAAAVPPPPADRALPLGTAAGVGGRMLARRLTERPRAGLTHPHPHPQPYPTLHRKTGPTSLPPFKHKQNEDSL